MLTNRYLTLQMLNQLPSNQYTDYRKDIQQDIDIINKNTKIEDLQSFKTITLKKSAEIVRLYNKNKSILYRLMNGEFDEEQHLYFALIRFAFSIYYINKPYLSDMQQLFQYNILKSAAFVLRLINFKFASATGNNLAMLATSCKVLYNYNINIKFSIENWEVE